QLERRGCGVDAPFDLGALHALVLAAEGQLAAHEAIDVVSTLAPEQRDRACEILEGDDDETIQAFAARVRERL
ncbi:MAG: hypothetical protein E6688_13950, partial [Eggerthella sp.]|nr:hypothetical protein [Eggerthella sp.]